MNFFFLLDACGLSFLLTVSILFFSMGVVIDTFTTLGVSHMLLIPSLKFLFVVGSNEFLEDMILVIDIIYPVYYKTKVIVQVISISV